MNRQSDDIETVPPDQCPVCNARRLFIHAMEHGHKIRDASELAVYYQGGGENHEVADFGVIEIHSYSGKGLAVVALGELMAKFDTEGTCQLVTGPWIATLAAIRGQLDARFGPVELSEDDGSHTMHRVERRQRNG